ncbi:Endonuclease III [bacterium HR36]|nr:Endonuclease III [bacterium HR36]
MATKKSHTLSKKKSAQGTRRASAVRAGLRRPLALANRPARKFDQQRRELARKVVETLRRLYPEAKCSLNYRTPLELLVATILSAQCTDERVNQVTPALFARFRTAADYANADPKELENYIRSTGFYRAKTRNIMACCRALVEKHAGELPRTLEALTQLPGVGRKTANVVLGTVWGIPGIVVDTHVKRLARRMGLTRHTDPDKIERDLMELIPQEEWVAFGHRMIYHGRQVCLARNPKCDQCPLNSFCPKVGVKRKKSRA